MRLKRTLRRYDWQIRQLASYMAKAREEKAVPAQLADLLVHKIRINTDPFDYYRFEFYKGGKTWEEKSRYVGKGGSRYYPYENNSVRYMSLFNNKLVTKAVLAGPGLPQPELLATIGEDYEIKSREQFSSFLDAADRDLVMKPLGDSGGRGVLVLGHDRGTWRVGGEACTPEEVWERIRGGLKTGYLAEERVRNTDQIAALYPHSLNTIHVVTIKTADGRWHAAHVGMRVGRGGKAVDNIGAGGILVWINEAGTTFQAYDFARSQPVTHHPDTGAPLIGVTVAGYPDAVDLGLRASERFGFMGIIGWDIALTDRGRLIVEGNSYPDAHFWQMGSAGGWITDEMARGLKQRRPFTRWDKTRIYPGFRTSRMKS